ncbi:hypothetical protein DPMN_060443 [Dreissena polymorpha]|uniref:Uncharacterized protein n=1 Tax=Dreissena polymorpha TaxID=45954 RepID=A0A9D4HHJ8_DREPO|nr:hypothetical protein DPMN_060443 [Dreissena polymorpha]
MVVDWKPCQDGRRRPRQYTLRGKHSSAIVFGYTPLILWEYLPREQAKPPGQDTKSHANTYTSQAHIHRLIYTG